jgi:hypothetical protein
MSDFLSSTFYPSVRLSRLHILSFCQTCSPAHSILCQTFSPAHSILLSDLLSCTLYPCGGLALLHSILLPSDVIEIVIRYQLTVTASLLIIMISSVYREVSLGTITNTHTNIQAHTHLHKYTHTHKQKDKHTHNHTDLHTFIHTNKKHVVILIAARVETTKNYCNQNIKSGRR